MFESPRRGRQARLYNKCSENSRSQIVFRLKYFPKIDVGCPCSLFLYTKMNISSSLFAFLFTSGYEFSSYNHLDHLFVLIFKGICVGNSLTLTISTKSLGQLFTFARYFNSVSVEKILPYRLYTRSSKALSLSLIQTTWKRKIFLSFLSFYSW